MASERIVNLQLKIVNRLWRIDSRINVEQISPVMRNVSLPCLLTMLYGIYMVIASDTCQETNPYLYYPTRDFIIAQSAIVPIFSVASILCDCGALALPPLSPWSPSGCALAVKRLQRVPRDAGELIDPEDGNALECTICIASLNHGHDVVVRTRCGHLYHEGCLSKWCELQRDCPLCRQLIGEPDPTAAQ
jgi:hypothetical protein